MGTVSLATFLPRPGSELRRWRRKRTAVPAPRPPRRWCGSYRGCVREPWSTSAVWEMHWERMELRSWLTAGWLHICGTGGRVTAQDAAARPRGPMARDVTDIMGVSRLLLRLAATYPKEPKRLRNPGGPPTPD